MVFSDVRIKKNHSLWQFRNHRFFPRYMVDIAVYLGAKKEIAEKELKVSLIDMNMNIN